MKQAFTLVELLVVFAIVAILAAILSPAFAQARRMATTGMASGPNPAGDVRLAVSLRLEENTPCPEWCDLLRLGGDVDRASELDSPPSRRKRIERLRALP